MMVCAHLSELVLSLVSLYCLFQLCTHTCDIPSILSRFPLVLVLQTLQLLKAVFQQSNISNPSKLRNKTKQNNKINNETSFVKLLSVDIFF